MNLEDRSKAVLFGAALGDALGWPIEFLGTGKIKAKYGSDGIQEPPTPALYTDDTQMTLALDEALIEAGDSDDIDRLMALVGTRFIEWNNSADNNRAAGHTVQEAIRTLEAGAPWDQTGVAGAKGCGSAMRVSGVGFLYQTDPDRLRLVAHNSGLITHAHPTADAASIAAAFLVKLALDGANPQTWITRTISFVAGISPDFEQTLSRIENVVGWTNEELATDNLGKGWTGDEAIALSIYCALRYPDDYVGAVRRAANISGDSDSVACITGSVMGARLGLDAIPADWIERLENRDYLTDVADRLAAKRHTLYGDSL